MMPVLSPNTQAILLLTAPLIVGRRAESTGLLSQGEYKRLARHLRDIHRQPADLLLPDSAEVLRACQPVIDGSRLQQLLARGFLLSQAIERWRARAIWVVSRADAEYPRRLKARLREDAPAILYGCGDMALLESGGLAVVGSRHVDESLIDYTMSIGRLAAQAGKTLVSGGAKGIDQAAMRGALDGHGSVCGILADGLEKNAMRREYRNPLLEGKLALISPYDPSSGFNVGNAMQRNKLIYALADTSLVVSSDLKRGGTWAGAVEQLEKFRFVPVFIRSSGVASVGLEELKNKGAIPWPNPQDVRSFEDVFSVQMAVPEPTSLRQEGLDLDLFVGESHPSVATIQAVSTLHDDASVLQSEGDVSGKVGTVIDMHPSALASKRSLSATTAAVWNMSETSELPRQDASPAEQLFAAVRAVIEQLVSVPMKDAEVADALNISNAQAKVWLKRLVAEGVLEKLKKPAGYIVKKKELF